MGGKTTLGQEGTGRTCKVKERKEGRKRTCMVKGRQEEDKERMEEEERDYRWQGNNLQGKGKGGKIWEGDQKQEGEGRGAWGGGSRVIQQEPIAQREGE